MKTYSDSAIIDSEFMQEISQALFAYNNAYAVLKFSNAENLELSKDTFQTYVRTFKDAFCYLELFKLALQEYLDIPIEVRENGGINYEFNFATDEVIYSYEMG